ENATASGTARPNGPPNGSDRAGCTRAWPPGNPPAARRACRCAGIARRRAAGASAPRLPPLVRRARSASSRGTRTATRSRNRSRRSRGHLPAAERLLDEVQAILAPEEESAPALLDDIRRHAEDAVLDRLCRRQPQLLFDLC